MGTSANIKINGISLYIPVERISVKQSFKNRENAPLRSSSSFTTSGFGSSINIDLSIISNMDSANITDMLRLFYSIKNFPYTFIESDYIKNAIVGTISENIQDKTYAVNVQSYINNFNKSNRYTVCVVHHMSCSTIPGTVDGIRLNLNMEYTVLAPFVPKLYFRKHYYSKDFLEDVYQEAHKWWNNHKDEVLREGKTKASVYRDFYDTRLDNVTGRIEDSEVYKRMVMPDIMKLPGISSLSDNAFEFILTDKYSKDNITNVSLNSGAVNFIALSISFSFPSMLLQGYPFPAHQYLGVSSSSVRVGIVAKQNDVNNNEAIKIANFYNALQAIDPDRQSKVKSGVMKTIMPQISVTNSFLNAFGIKNVVFKHIGKETLQGTADGENLVISLIDTDRSHISSAPRAVIKAKRPGDIFKKIIGQELINRGYAKQFANMNIFLNLSYSDIIAGNDNFSYDELRLVNQVVDVRTQVAIIGETIVKSVVDSDFIFDQITVRELGERSSLFNICLDAAEKRIRAVDSEDLGKFIDIITKIVREIGSIRKRGKAENDNFVQGTRFAISVSRGRHADFSRNMVKILLAFAYVKYCIEAISSIQKDFVVGNINIATDGVVKGRTASVFAEKSVTDFKFIYDPFPDNYLEAFDELANLSTGGLAEALRIDFLGPTALNLSNEIDNFYNGVGYPDFGDIPDHPMLKYLEDTGKEYFGDAVKKRVNPDFFMYNGPQLTNISTKVGKKTNQPLLMNDSDFIRVCKIFIDAQSKLYDSEAEGVFDEINKKANYELRYKDGIPEAIKRENQGNKGGTKPSVGSDTTVSVSKNTININDIAQKLNKYDQVNVDEFISRFPSGYKEKRLKERLSEYSSLPDSISPSSDEAIRILKHNVEFNYLRDNPGMIKGMPTFKIYFMDKKSTNTKDWHILEDFYDMNGLIELRYVEERNSPVQTVFMTVVSPAHRFMVPVEQYGTYYSDPNRANLNKKQLANPAEADKKLKELFPLQEGVDVQIRIGYDDDPHNMTSVINGFVSSLSGGEILNITITSYGAELIIDKRIESRIIESIDDDIILGVSRIVLNQEHVRHFGRWQLDKMGQTAFKTELQKLFNGTFLSAAGFLGGSILDRNRLSRTIDERILTATGWASSNYDENVYSFTDNELVQPSEIKGKNYSSWDFIKELELIFPGYYSYVLPYEDRVTLFIGSSQNVYAYRDYNSAELLLLKNKTESRTSPYTITGFTGVINRILSKDKINIKKQIEYSSLPTGLPGDRIETVDDVRAWIADHLRTKWGNTDLVDTIYSMMFVPESNPNTQLNPFNIIDNLTGILTARSVLNHESIIPFVGDFMATIDIGEWINTNRIDFAAYIGGSRKIRAPEAITRSVVDKFMHIYLALSGVSDRKNFTVFLMLFMNKIDDAALFGAVDSTKHNYEWLKAISSILASQSSGVSEDFLIKASSKARTIELSRFVAPEFEKFINKKEKDTMGHTELGRVGDNLINLRSLFGDEVVSISNYYWQDIWFNLNMLIVKAFGDSQNGKNAGSSNAIKLLNDMYSDWSGFFNIKSRTSLRKAIRVVAKQASWGRLSTNKNVAALLSYVPFGLDVVSDTVRYVQAYAVLSSKLDPNSGYITKFVDITGLAKNRYKRFKQYHLVSSITNIIHNDMVLKDNNVFNAVKIAEQGDHTTSGSDDETDWLMLKFDSGLPQWKTKVYPYINPNADSEELKKRYASRILSNKLAASYDGKIIILLNPEIKAKDSIFLQDTYRKMVGIVDIQRVVHVYSRNGCYTEIKPTMRVECYDTVEPSFLVVLGIHLSDMVGTYNSEQQSVQVVVPNDIKSEQLEFKIDSNSLEITGQDLSETIFDAYARGTGLIVETLAVLGIAGGIAVGTGIGVSAMSAVSAMIAGISLINVIYGRDEYKVPIALRPVLQDNKPYIGSLIQKGPMNYIGYMAQHWTNVVVGTDIIIRKLTELKNIKEPRIYRKWIFDQLK